MEEKRRHYRAKTVNLISYECVDENGSPWNQGMGRILDISKGGLLMETEALIQAKYVLLLSTDVEEELIKIKGEIIYSRNKKPKVFHTGIRFIEKDEKIREIVKTLIKAFLKTKAVKPL